MDINDLSNAFILCTCGGQVCSRQCQICSSPTWEHSPCIQQLWHEHGSKEAGKVAAQRFTEAMTLQGRGTPGPDGRVPLADVLRNVHLHYTPTTSDEKIVERAIDWMEDQGIVLQPWQATALRAIMRRP